ncbi:MAG: YdcF family protein [Fuerstia sp.]|nr:YdcF family protein [Fuerstiella sp.]
MKPAAPAARPAPRPAPQYTRQGYAQQNAPGWIGVSRGTALGIAIITTLNLLEVFAFSTSAVHNWLCDFRMITQPLSIAILAMLATATLMYSVKPALPVTVWMATIGLVSIVVVFAGWELWEVTQRVPENLRQTAMSRPLGILMLFAVAGMGILVGDSPASYGRSSLLIIGGSSILTVMGFAVVTLQSGSIGDPIPSDAAPAILILGCAVESDGTPSEALTDRMATGDKLFLDGHGKLLVLSGGPSEGSVTESAAMKKLALAAGVPETKLLLDSAGINAADSVRYAAALPELKDDRRIIVVSHWYQLARIRMLGRQAGLQVIAVPAEQQHALFNQNRIYAQEVTAFLTTCFKSAARLVQNQ